MASMLRRRKVSETDQHHDQEEEDTRKEKIEAKGKGKVKEIKRNGSKWWCVDNCCWFIGWIISIWWLLTVLYNSLPQFVTDSIIGPLPDPPGLKLKKEGLQVHHPVVFVPGIVTGGLELWEGRPWRWNLRRSLQEIKLGPMTSCRSCDFVCVVLAGSFASNDLSYFFHLIVDPHTMEVDGKVYSTKHILVYVGGFPSIPNIPGKEHAINSNVALDLPSRTKKITIIGGGYIALEFASISNGLSSDVHVFIRWKKVLRGFNEECQYYRKDINFGI